MIWEIRIKMIDDEFLDEMWQKVRVIQGFIIRADISTVDLEKLLTELNRLQKLVKNPEITSLWGKPMGYWIELEKSISSWEYPSGLAWHNWQLKMDNEGLHKSLTEAININIEMRRALEKSRAEASMNMSVIMQFASEHRELKQKLLELGGCPNAG